MRSTLVPLPETIDDLEFFGAIALGVIEHPIDPYFGTVYFQNQSWPACYYDVPTNGVDQTGDQVYILGRKRGILLVGGPGKIHPQQRTYV